MKFFNHGNNDPLGRTRWNRCLNNDQRVFRYVLGDRTNGSSERPVDDFISSQLRRGLAHIEVDINDDNICKRESARIRGRSQITCCKTYLKR